MEEGHNDGAALLSALAAESSADESPEGRVIAVLSALRGPWALVYWQAASGRLWFGRDAVGAPLKGACFAALCCAMAQHCTCHFVQPAVAPGLTMEALEVQDGAACWFIIQVQHAHA